jgi:hypothetical protein
MIYSDATLSEKTAILKTALGKAEAIIKTHQKPLKNGGGGGIPTVATADLRVLAL